MNDDDKGLFMLDETAHKERSEVTPAEIRNGIVGFIELAFRMRGSPQYGVDPRVGEAYAAAIMNLMAFCIEFAEPMASMPEAKVNWRGPIHTLAIIARAQKMPGLAGRVMRSAVEAMLGEDVFK